jgi:hypothetical protein
MHPSFCNEFLLESTHTRDDARAVAALLLTAGAALCDDATMRSFTPQ